MNELDLYAKIEPYLNFTEIDKLYQKYYQIIHSLDKKSIIDIGCGNGKFLQNLNIEEKFGIDLSNAQVKKTLSLGIKAKAIDICKINQSFDIATAVFDVINYIPEKKLKSFFQCVYDRLNKNGNFIFDINSLYGFENIADGAITIDKDHLFIAIDAVYKNKQLKTKITCFEKQQQCYIKQSNQITQYYHKLSFLKNILQKIGFSVKTKKIFLYGNIADKYLFICYK